MEEIKNTLLKFKDSEEFKNEECWNCKEITTWKLCKNGNYYARCFNCGARAFTCNRELKQCKHEAFKKTGKGQKGKGCKFLYSVCYICKDKIFIPLPLEVLEKEKSLADRETALIALKKSLEERQTVLASKERAIEAKQTVLASKERAIEVREQKLAGRVHYKNPVRR